MFSPGIFLYLFLAFFIGFWIRCGDPALLKISWGKFSSFFKEN
jgi:hypothetical protein